MTKPQTIAEYIEAAPQPAKEKLQEMLSILREAAPGAKEDLKWSQPALSYDWILFQFAAFKDHISLYPTPSVITVLKDELTEYKTSMATVQFSLDNPLPKDLIRKIADLRVKEAEKGVKWM